ncbi:MAG: caspase family protein [Vicinamibacteria bacterium]
MLLILLVLGVPTNLRGASHRLGPRQNVNRGVITVQTEEGNPVDLYSGSYALLIGNSEYEHWDRLQWPTRDVDEIAAVLRELGFETEVHKDLSDQAFRQVMAQFQTNQGREAGARLLVYYAGHGHTVRGTADRSFGYIAMTNTPDPRLDHAGFEARAISMEWFVTYAQKIEARHVLFVFDSCFSGALLNVRAEVTPEPIREFVARPVRAFLTAGRADEPVPDRSIFKTVLLDILEGLIDEPIKDGYLTGDELGLLMKTAIPEYSAAQHPQYGKIRDPELDKGDFVFVLKGRPPRTTRSNPSDSSSATSNASSAIPSNSSSSPSSLASVPLALRRFESAMEAMDFASLRGVYPGAPLTFQQSFEMASSWQVELRCDDPVVVGNGATVKCECVHEIQFKTRDRESFTRHVTFTLHRQGSSWLIQDVTQH